MVDQVDGQAAGQGSAADAQDDEVLAAPERGSVDELLDAGAHDELDAMRHSTALRRLETKAVKSHRLAAARKAGSRRASSRHRSRVKLRNRSLIWGPMRVILVALLRE